MARFLLPLQDPPEIWSPDDVCYLVHEDTEAGDAAARQVQLPPWLVRRRVRLGRSLEGKPLALFERLTPAQRDDALDGAEDWTDRPALLLPEQDAWQATARVVRLIAERCPDVFQHLGRLRAWDGNPLSKPEIRNLLARLSGQEAPKWLVETLDAGTDFGEIPRWTPERGRAAKPKAQKQG